MKDLINILQSIGDIPNAQIQRFIQLARGYKIAQGSYFIQQGCGTDGLGFIEKGLFRNVYLTEDGDECTFAFSAENEFIFECQAMRTTEAAHYSIQALEHSTILAIDYKSWVEPFKDSVWWHKILLDLTAAESSQKSSREIMLMSLAGKDRYALFREQYSHLEHRLKQHMIANPSRAVLDYNSFQVRGYFE